jgi:hypothetical protein
VRWVIFVVAQRVRSLLLLCCLTVYVIEQSNGVGFSYEGEGAQDLSVVDGLPYSCLVILQDSGLLLKRGGIDSRLSANCFPQSLECHSLGFSRDQVQAFHQFPL